MWNITEFCKDNKIPFQIKRSWVQIESCPFCGHTGFKGAFSITKGTYNCWACRKTTGEEAVAALLLCTEMEAKEIIWSYKGEIDRRLYTAEENRKNATAVKLPGEKGLLKVHRSYLENRNFDPDELIRDWDLMSTGPCPDPPYTSWKFRLVFPIKLNGVTVSFQARDVTGQSDIRYMGATVEQSVYHYKKLLYGQEYCTPEIIGLTEGIFDMYRMGKGFVCTFGTSMTSAQLNLIAKHHEKALFLFDPDDPNAGKKAKGYCLSLKSMGIKAVSVSWDGGDPGSMSPEDASYMRNYLGFPAPKMSRVGYK